MYASIFEIDKVAAFVPKLDQFIMLQENFEHKTLSSRISYMDPE